MIRCSLERKIDIEYVFNMFLFSELYYFYRQKKNWNYYEYS